jgi:glycosyltransferase involved in cell wall biosynthesis
VKVIHIPFCFYPDPVGGTEVYVAALAKLLQEEHGIDVVVAAPGEKSCEYLHDGLRVRRFAVCPQPKDLAELYGEGDALAAREFECILDEEKPDAVHLHAFTRGVSLRLVRAARRRGIRILLTYHTPTVSCTRGTMMRWGTEPCDGLMDARTCAACTLHGKGMPRLAARALAHFNFPLSTFNFRAATPLRMRSLIELRHQATRALFHEVDHVIAVCEWVRNVLLRNDVPAEQITLSRQGVAPSLAPRSELPALSSALPASSSLLPAFSSSRPLRLCYFGRLDETKGVHLLISALHLLPSAPVTLDIYGVAQPAAGADYVKRLKHMAGNDARIEFHPPVPAGDVVATIRRHDVLAVPSQWLETGPLVALEAAAAGVPVLGSNLGGIAELVTDQHGWLVSPDDPRAWAAKIGQLVEEPSLVAAAQTNLLRARVRCMSQVAAEMASHYLAHAPHQEVCASV